VQVVLHPTDFSEPSHEAFELACSIAREHGARLIVLHVRTPAKVALYNGVPAVEQLDRHDRQEEEMLRRVQPPDAGVQTEHRMAKGLPAEEIVRLARETQSDLIVMGTHGRTGLRRLLLGSVAEQVIRQAPCPVIVVKTPVAPEEHSRAEPAAQTGSSS
jgi:nucleotide-binding universal stress UspA family protein